MWFPWNNLPLCNERVVSEYLPLVVEDIKFNMLNTLQTSVHFSVFKTKHQSIVSVSVFVGDQPSLDLLWFSTGPEVSALRLASFFSIFDCQEFSELYGTIDDSLLAALCLVTYIALQVMLTFYNLIYFSTK